MSTQSTSNFPSIPFSITHPFQNLRLLELPPDLLDLITTNNNNSNEGTKNLYLKSSSSTKSNQQEYLHLCTDDKIWLVRQVNTSNTVFITKQQPQPQPQEQQSNGLTAFSQVNNILELSEKQVSWTDVEKSIRDVIPLYPYPHSNSAESDDGGGIMISKYEDIFEDILAPNNYIRNVLAELFVFGLPSESSTSTSSIDGVQTDTRMEKREDKSKWYIPTASLLLTSWKALLRCSTIGGISLESSTSSSIYERLLSSISTDEDDGLLLSSVARVMLNSFSSSSTPSSTMPSLNLDQSKTINSLGRLLVRYHGSIRKDDLLSEWKEIVPGSWARCFYIDSGLLGEEKNGSRYVEEVEDGGVVVVRYIDSLATGSSRITIDGSNIAATNDMGGSGVQMKTTGNNNNSNKRKWHEKFGAQRNK